MESIAKMIMILGVVMIGFFFINPLVSIALAIIIHGILVGVSNDKP